MSHQAKGGVDMPYKYVGHSLPRVDAKDKVTGAAIYGADVFLPRMLYARVLRSPHAHARIVSIDVSGAEALQGVVAVATGADVVGILGGEAMKDMPFLAIDKVRFVGEPVAAVAAENLDIAEEALGLIRVQYEELPPALDVELAMSKDSPIVHEDMDKYGRIGAVKLVPGTNICNQAETAYGDVEKGFAEADYVFEDTFRTHMVQHGQIEPHSVIAQLTPMGKLNLWVPNDGPHRLRKDLSDAMKIPINHIRVRSTYIGGGFGGKGGLKAEPVAVALARKTKHRPVKLVFTREEVFQASVVRHPTIIKVKTGVNKDGTLVAREISGIWDTGAYAEKGPTVVIQATAAAAGPYKIPHVRLKGYCVYTNKVIAGAYRGYGTNQVTWAYESQMDMIAERLDLDPLEFRLKNVLREGDSLPTGGPATSVGVAECLEKVAKEIGWERRNQLGPNRGIGIACTYKNTKTPSGSAAYMTLNGDGSLNVIVSAVEIGQGARTVFSQMAAEVLDIPMDKITVSSPDTDSTPYDASTTSSRATFHVGNAICMAAEDIKQQLLKIAAGIFDCSSEALVYKDGKIAGPEAEGLTYAQILGKVYGAGGVVMGRGFYYSEAKGSGMWSAPSVYWMYGANAVEVEVDPQTGKIKILKMVIAHDVGQAINPVNCCQQMEGGVLHAMGIATTEEVRFDKGRILNPNFHDYKMPTAMDAPEIVPIIVEAHHPEGPFGAKGIGEPVLNPTAAAIAQAVFMAIGVRVMDLPLSAEKIFRRLHDMG